MRTQLLLIVAAGTLTMGARCAATREASAGGDVIDTSQLRPADYTLTSDTYNKWVRAQWALDTVDLSGTPRIDPRSATQADVDRVVRSLEENARARAVIEDADLSVQDFVMTSIALAQSWDAAQPGTVPRQGATAENVAFLRERAARDSTARVRPHVAFIDDESDSEARSSDRDSDNGKHEGKHRGRGKGHGKGHGKGKGH